MEIDMLLPVGIIIILVLLAGTFAGLTLALFSLKLSELERKIRVGNPYAQRIYEIRKKGNLLLCTLLLGNVASYTAMTIFLESITSSITAGIIATALIFVLAEILPQAVFPKYALFIGAKLSGLVWVALILFYPISAPIAWILDKILGTETPVLWSKEELGEIIKYHEDVGDGIIDSDEERIILGALSFSEVKVGDIMVPKKDVFYLRSDVIIDGQTLEKIKTKGYSKIPVIDSKTQNVFGLIRAKTLLGVIPEVKTAENFVDKNMIKIGETMTLDTLLNIMIKRKTQIAVVLSPSGQFSGVVTLEDIMEEILRIEIDDKN